VRFGREWKQVLQRMSGSLPHDEFLYLGGNEQSTHKYVSELLGKETIDTNTYGKSTGRSGNYSTNYQISGRELLTPDEVRMLDNQYSLLFIRGERPIMDLKYDILKHPNVALTTDGKAPAYRHGEVTQAVASIVFDDALWDEIGDSTDEGSNKEQEKSEENSYAVVSAEEILDYFERKELEERNAKEKKKTGGMNS